MTTNLNTPYFLLNEDLLEDNISAFKTALSKYWPNSILAYSVKTNSLPWLLEWMNNHNVFAEVVSDDEFQLALQSGYSKDKIVFNGPIKTNRYLELATQGGSIINIDSTHELDYFTNHRPDVKGMIGLRVNIDPGIFSNGDIGFLEDGFRFGFSYENKDLIKAINRLVSIYGNKQIGLHLHVNSITRSLNVYQAISSYAVKLIKALGFSPAYIDIGGGFFGGVPGKSQPEEYVRVIKNELQNEVDINKTILIIEPGSAIIGSAIDFHTSVIDVKNTSHGRIVTTDGSRINIDPLWIKEHYTFSTTSNLQPYPRQVICGYTCMDHDRIMVIEDSPELRINDQIIYKRVGNYTVTVGGPFIQPFPAVYVLNDAGIQLIRKKMTIEEYYRIETV